MERIDKMTLQDAANIATILGAVAIILAYWQFKADHERSRREKTVEFLFEWTTSIREETSAARKIVESLDEPQSRNLQNLDTTKIPIKHKATLLKLLNLNPENDLAVEGDNVILLAEQTSKLRWYIISYLNHLETILVAWQSSIVDTDILEKELSYLFSTEHGYTALKKFRDAAGGSKVFPAIEAFSLHLEEKRKREHKRKSNVA